MKLRLNDSKNGIISKKVLNEIYMEVQNLLVDMEYRKEIY